MVLRRASLRCQVVAVPGRYRVKRVERLKAQQGAGAVVSRIADNIKFLLWHASLKAAKLFLHAQKGGDTAAGVFGEFCGGRLQS